MNRQVVERDIFPRVQPVFELTSVDWPGVITVVRKAWDLIAAVKDAYAMLRMAQMQSPELRNFARNFSGMAPVLIYPSLYRAPKLIFPTDVGGNVTDARITTDLGIGSLGKRPRY